MGIIKDFFREDVFTLAYRQRDKDDPEDNLLDNPKSKFSTLEISSRYWYADPIIIKKNDGIYVFFEMFDRHKERGVIGFSQVLEGGALTEPQAVLNTGYHLSYPFIFEKEGKTYMIPETQAKRRLELYVSRDFPYGWERIGVIKNHVKLHDSTMTANDEGMYLFTGEAAEGPFQTKLLVYNVEFNDGKIELYEHPSSPLSEDNSCSRPAGRIFYHNRILVRPSQDCSKNNYGRALVFNRILRLDRKECREIFYRRIEPKDLKINFNKDIRGVHTYGQCEGMEIIDIKYSVFSIKYAVKRFRYVAESLIRRRPIAYFQRE